MEKCPKKVHRPKQPAQVKITETFSGQASLRELLIQILLNQQVLSRPQNKQP